MMKKVMLVHSENRQEEALIIARYEKRQDLLAEQKAIGKNRLTQLKSEMQQDHQKILLWEAQAEEEERQKWLTVRQNIEKQQQQFQQLEALDFQQKTAGLAPRPTTGKNVVMAFLVGGLICAIGQAISNLFAAGGLNEKEVGAATAAVLVFSGVFLTALGVYDELGKHAGAGSIVPITGFANSIAASALEFKREGFVYGVGAKIFTVAGPVIAYGTIVSIFIGLVYFFVK